MQYKTIHLLEYSACSYKYSRKPKKKNTPYKTENEFRRYTILSRNKKLKLTTIIRILL